MTEAEKMSHEISTEWYKVYGEYELPDKEIAKLIQQVAERTRKECFWSTGDGGCFNARWEDEEVKK